MSQSSLAAKARYRERHREMLRERNREYHKRKPEMRTRYRKINREKWLPKARIWEHNRRARIANATGTFTETEWLVVCDRFDFRCPACGLAVKLTQDHIIPLTKGGSNDISNIQPLCDSCNKKKGNRLIVCFLPYNGDNDACESQRKSFWKLIRGECLSTPGTSTTAP